MGKRPSAAGKTVAVRDLCDFENGHGFSPSDWSDTGLPIIRIQNLNGSDRFNRYYGEPDQRWIVEPGDLLFAWAGVKGVSFGATVWPGPRGVLNQHIYRLRPKGGIDTAWLSHALQWVTFRIERKAHGFKSSLVHVRKADIDGQLLHLPAPKQQKETAQALDCWDRAVSIGELLLKTRNQQRLAIERRCFAPKEAYQTHRADALFNVHVERAVGDERLLSVTQDEGVVPRDEREGRVTMPTGDLRTFKRVQAGHFVISLRSFQGGVELCHVDGIVSPAYTVLAPGSKVHPGYFRHYFKSADFIRRLSVAVVGIRDGKQINWPEFRSIKLPLPSLEEQSAMAQALDTLARETSLVRDQIALIRQQKQALLQKLLWSPAADAKHTG